MRIKRDNRIKIAFTAILCLLIPGGFFETAKSFSPVALSDLDYFKGNWLVTMRGNPKSSFHWSVKEDLQGGWITGVVEQNGAKVSTDFWRRVGGQLERFAFTADGTFVKLASPGWEADRLILTGVASDKNGETKIRETITKVSEREFQALWERSSGGKWTVFADELCTRQ